MHIYIFHWLSLWLWQEARYLAASMQQFCFSPSRYFNFSFSDTVTNSGYFSINLGKNEALISVYLSQCSKKWVSVSTVFCVHSGHSLSSLGRQACLRRPVSMARLCPLSLYLVSSFLNMTSVTEVRYSATMYCRLRVK